ncbi:MAG: proline dehydrogenase family protein [Deltaproteobacteria bacterium]|nr:proline dehydrogenase family protein [Deltaproteobacteria bacterium]
MKKNRKNPVSFQNTAIAFKDKSKGDLFLSFVIFSLTKSPFLVKFLSRAVKLALSMGLPVKPLIKATVFKQFCGGEKETEYAKVIKKLGAAHIGSILDYSVEGGEDEAGFEATKSQLLKIIEKSQSNPDIPCTCMKMTAIGLPALFQKVTARTPLSKQEKQAFEKVENRLDEICKAASSSGKPIYIDAEESWIQKAVDDLAEKMMARYNQENAIVFTTLQLYRWDRIDYFKRLISAARSGSYRLGIKIVRGAYLEKERERANALGYPSPVNATKAETDAEYNQALQIFVENIDVVEICVGTHNEHSCTLLTQYMADHRIPNDHPHIYFSQLYGMSDHISYNLADAGYNVSKYLPFGPVAATLPYLVRRAEENTAIAGQMSKELEIITRECRRRKKAKQKRA